MKKIYLSPEIYDSLMETEQMMAASQGAVLMDGEADPEGTVLSRENKTIWDDDEF